MSDVVFFFGVFFISCFSKSDVFLLVSANVIKKLHLLQMIHHTFYLCFFFFFFLWLSWLQNSFKTGNQAVCVCEPPGSLLPCDKSSQESLFQVLSKNSLPLLTTRMVQAYKDFKPVVLFNELLQFSEN